MPQRRAPRLVRHRRLEVGAEVDGEAPVAAHARYLLEPLVPINREGRNVTARLVTGWRLEGRGGGRTSRQGGSEHDVRIVPRQGRNPD